MADRNVVGKRPTFVEQLGGLKDNDESLVGVKEDGTVKLYKSTKKLLAEVDDSKKRLRLARASEALEEAFKDKFGEKIGPKLLARTAASQSVDFGVALTVADAKKLLNAAPGVAKRIEISRAFYEEPADEDIATLCAALKLEVQLPEAKMFLESKPKGMAIDGDGRISGKQSVKSVPIEAGGRLATCGGYSLEDVFRKCIQDVLETARGEKAENLGRVTLPDGTAARVTCPSGTTADFGRMDYKIAIPTEPDGWYQYHSKKNTNDTARSEEVVRALGYYTGNDQAVTVLAAVLGQAAMYTLQDFLTGADGKGITRLAAVGGLGSAQWTLTKDADGNYIIGFEFPKNFKVQGPFGEKGEALEKTNALKLGLSKLVRTENNYVGMTFRMNIVVDAAEAAKGELKLSIPGGMEIEFHDEL